MEPAGVLAGPLVGMFLAEHGARVIKIEPTGRGDVTRTWKVTGEPGNTTVSSYFSCANWGKESVALNLKSDEGREIFHQLTGKSDIVLTSYKAGDAEKLQVDYPTLRECNSGLIYGAITGFGDGDPRPAFDAVIQAESGFMYMNGTTESGPLKMPVALMDVLAAHHLKEKILLALLQKERGGKGAYLSVSLMEAALASLANQGSGWLVAGAEPENLGSEHPHIYPYGSVFETGDGIRVLLAIGNDAQFRLMMELLENANIADNPKFSTNPERSANRDELRPILSDIFRNQQDGKTMIESFKSRRIPCGEILPVSAAIERHGGPGFFSGTHPDYGAIKGIPTGNPESAGWMSPPPELGSSTKSILNETLGIKNSKLDELHNSGTIAVR